MNSQRCRPSPISAQVAGCALEAKVAAANADLTDPVGRLVGGMRGREASTGIDHDLDRGIRADLEALVEAGLARPEAVRSGVRCWG